jgi:hypothetical protein
LEANLQHIRFVFAINDISYVDVLKGEYFDSTNAQDATHTDSCYGMGGVASGWQAGQTQVIKIGLEVNDAINNGWYDFPAGTSQTNIFLMDPALPATDTPLPSPTKTPKPVITYAPPATAAAPKTSCMIDSNMLLGNRTGSQATIYLRGPANFTFVLAPGEQNTVKVCSGCYNYTFMGACTGSGRLCDGDNGYFTCGGGN